MDRPEPATKSDVGESLRRATEKHDPDARFHDGRVNRAAQESTIAACETERPMSAREILLGDIARQEQKLLDKLVALHTLRDTVAYARLSEVELLLKANQLQESLRY